MKIRRDGVLETVPVSGPLTDAQLRASAVAATDRYSGGEVLADQAGAGGVLTFTFSSAVDLIWVRCDGGDARADPFGGTPAVDAGIICEDGVPQPITLTASTVKVWAPSSSSVSVWGYRYG